MKVLIVSAEVAPFAKVGGLADVAGSLPKALAELGHDVRVAMPGYRMALASGPRLIAKDVVVETGGRRKPADLYEGAISGSVPVYMIAADEWFAASDRSEAIYQPGADQHVFFAQAVIESCEALDWIPDVVHANDWHTGFVPVLMRERAGAVWDETAAVFTIHNLAYQGEFGADIIQRAGLDPRLFNMHQLETFGQVNFLKAGCVFSDMVNTVSPTYAREIQTPEYGCRLHGLMSHLAQRGRLRGILNGIDTELFDPAADPATAAPFDASDLGGKSECRRMLLRELGLPEDLAGPVMGIVSRLSEQKGIDLVLDAAHAIGSMGAALVVQGLGDGALAARLNALQAAAPNSVRFIEKFDAAMAQRIYAGSDLFLMPSRFEPCGLGQMIALRYGAIPVVRRTGGLADTVLEPGNGFVFDEPDSGALLDALQRAYRAFAGGQWQELVKHAMRADFGWGRSARDYEAMYEDALRARLEEVAPAWRA